MSNEITVGMKFGTKRVLERIKTNKNIRFKCICDQCKSITYPDARTLKSNARCWCQLEKDRDLTGMVFGDRRVIGRRKITASYITPEGEVGYFNAKDPNTMNVWECECVHCKGKAYISTYDLKHGKRTVCHHQAIFSETYGILYPDFKTTHPLNHIYNSMKNNCFNPTSKYYRYYVGLDGPRMAEEWYDPENPEDETGFHNFFKWAMEAGYIIHRMPSGRNCCRLVRKDPNQGFTPENCEWQFLRSYQQELIANADSIEPEVEK